MANPIVQQINAELAELQKELAKFKDTVDYLNGAKSAVKDAVVKVNHSEAHFNKKVEELKSTYNSIIGLSESVSSVMNKLDTINFPERLNHIEKTVRETILYLHDIKEATLDELREASIIISKVDFEGRFQKLQKTIDSSVTSNQNLANAIINLKVSEKINAFEKSINNTLDENILAIQKTNKQSHKENIKTITDLNLSEKFDKIEAKIPRILSAIQDMHTRIDQISEMLDSKIHETLSVYEVNMTSSQEKIHQTLNHIVKEFESSRRKQLKLNYVTWVIIAVCTAIIVIF
jgi:uncharacterized coiled-coil protein SlyX